MAGGLGLDTMGALHSGADFMAEKVEVSEPEERMAGNSIFKPGDDDTKLAHDEDDARELQELRERRFEELKAAHGSARYGNGVKEVHQNNWAGEVVEASKLAWVVVHLYREENPFW